MHSSPSLEKLEFRTGAIVSLEWPNLVPRLRIAGCFEIHNQKISARGVTLPMRLLHGALDIPWF